MSSDLATRLQKLKTIELGSVDLKRIEKELRITRNRIDVLANQMESLEKAVTQNYVNYLRLQRRLENEQDFLDEIGAPLKKDIRSLVTQHDVWAHEKNKWLEGQSTLRDELHYDQLDKAFAKAFASIEAAQEYIRRKMEPLTAMQAKIAELSSTAGQYSLELNAQLSQTRNRLRFDSSPPMYSPDYFRNLNSGLWATSRDSIGIFSLPSSRLVRLNSYYSVLLLLFFAAASAIIYTKRKTIASTEGWEFVAQRPFATVLFVTSLTGWAVMQFLEPETAFLRLLLKLAMSGACIRLIGRVLQNKSLIATTKMAMIVYVVSELIVEVNLPFPFVRLYLFIVSLMTIVLLLKLSFNSQISQQWAYSFRSVSIWFCVILATDFFGRAGLARYLFASSVETLVIFIVLTVAFHLSYGCIHWLFFSSSLWTIKSIRSDAKDNTRKVSVLFQSILLVFLAVPATLVSWELYSSIVEALQGILSPGFVMGGQTISVGLILSALVTLYSSFYAAQLVPKVALDEAIIGRQIERGVRLSVGRLIQYFIAFVGVLVTCYMLNIDLTNLTIILSALGVGIGFGLQGIVNNFVSGLILLFERPIRVGDTIQLGEQWAYIEKIGARATVVKMFDESEIVVPNSNFINNQVINWTLNDRQVRLSIPVGVDYGADLNLVVETLLACAKENEAIFDKPESQVLFLNTGDSSLDFELRVWINDVDTMLTIQSDLYHEIVRRFREADITIPFPQRDLHLKKA